MRLSPDMLAAAYDLLRTTKPFVGWNLPEPEDVVFAITKHRVTWGDYGRDTAGRHQIRLSARRHTRLTTLLATMAHEVIHLHMEQVGVKGSVEHGLAFRSFAKQVCREHQEFDPEQF